jgi:hypothetical protein
MPNCDLCKGSFPTEQLVPISGKTVCAKCKPELVMNLKSGVSAEPRIDPRTAQEIKKRISRLHMMAWLFILPGIILLVLAGGARGAAKGAPGVEAAAGALAIQGLGSILFIIGLVFYARMKGRSGVMGLLGLLSCIGLIILNYLPKNCLHCRASASYRAKECSACGAPM